jgi:shikimate dehydrogenase
MADRYGLIGKSLGHSFSKEIHGSLGNYDYDLIEVQNSMELKELLKDRSKYQGFNVTIPYKKEVMKYCDVVTKEAKESNAVNTLYYKDNDLVGHNTDVNGVLHLIEKVENPGRVIILGSGGASGAVAAALRMKGIKDYTIISREGENNYNNLNRYLDANTIINTTPVGMYPDNYKSPLDDSPYGLKDFKNLNTVIDVIYNPNKTKLILDAEKGGIKTISGMVMLVAQAIYSAKEWGAIEDKQVEIDRIAVKLLKKKQNIVLIGMPGAGKTTVAKGLSRLYQVPYYDTDKLIVERVGRSIENIFETSDMGESYFRKKETEVLEEVSKLSGVIIATGGGIVLSEKNRDLIRQNGICIYLKRDLSILSKKGRPLTKKKGVLEIFNERSSIYEALADIMIENNRAFEGNYYKELKDFSIKVKTEIDKYYNNMRSTL